MEFIEDFSNNRKFDPKFQVKLKPIFHNIVEFYILIELPKNESNRWPIKFYLKFHNENFFTPLADLWKYDELFNEKFVSVLLKKKEFLNLLLDSIRIAVKVFPSLNRALKNNYPQNIEMTSSEISEFLNHPIELLKHIGFKIQYPTKLRLSQKRGLSARLLIGSKSYKGKSDFSLDSLLDFRWEILFFGKPIGLDELKRLLKLNNPLIKWRSNKWIFINKEDLSFLRWIYDSNGFSGKMMTSDVIKLELLDKYTDLGFRRDYKIKLLGNLRTKIKKIKNKLDFKLLEPPKGFLGELRDYQQAGLSWLAMLCDMGIGVCLGDDMGLGKTIQILAYLLYRLENYPNEEGSILVVCPTSLLTNWEHEIIKFAPKLKVLKYYGHNRVNLRDKREDFLIAHQIILTSYGIIRNDIDFLKNIQFSGIIIDESTNIKNPKSKRAKSIYLLKGIFRIALSGTPIENRLEELWSLFNFLNPGLLGSLNEFKKIFVNPIQNYQNAEKIKKLKSIIDPFILRRLKIDKKVIKDLPEKNEIKIYVNLSESQISLYTKIVDEIVENIRENYNSVKTRNGLVLKLLTKLKQLCNHPLQYLKIDPTKYDFNKNLKDFLEQSPKIARIFDIVENILENDQKVLIFSQYKTLGDILLMAFTTKFGKLVSFYHGSLTPNQRDGIVKDFQSRKERSSKILIASLKAGGFGLNLTQGTTVIHVDRWWNPSTESQATDRAYRIGQDQNVNVYKFVATGTIEEKIDKLLEEKRKLSRQIITPTSSIISRLPIDEIEELFSLMP
ncbi:MAG: DEAD/DEAH box helicase [Candidatus Lokiarchaeota archaeon]|nr:DEAD/DEAH box helicase [Candidatus Lokiarchaeota archaeon]